MPGQGRECSGRKFLKKKNTLVNRKIHSLKEKTLVVKKNTFCSKSNILEGATTMKQKI